MAGLRLFLGEVDTVDRLDMKSWLADLGLGTCDSIGPVVSFFNMGR